MLRRARIVAVLGLVLATGTGLAGCGGDDDGTPPPAATAPAIDRRPEADLRREAAPVYRRWRAEHLPALRRAARRIAAARADGDASATAVALGTYGSRARAARADLVRIRMPLSAWDPAAYLANALAAAVTAGDRQRADLAAGREPSAARWRGFAAAQARQRTGDARLRARLGIGEAGG